ncbi:unnamed protein product [Prunus armeniaca]
MSRITQCSTIFQCKVDEELAKWNLNQVPERRFLEQFLLPFIELVFNVCNDAVESINVAPKLDIVRKIEIFDALHLLKGAIQNAKHQT